MNSKHTIIFVDIETAGLGRRAPIIELAAIATQAGTFAPLESMELKIAFDIKHANVRSLGVTKFSPTAWEQYAIPEQDAAAKFACFLSRHATHVFESKRSRSGAYSLAKLAAYNAEFDASRLYSWGKRSGVYFPMMRMSLCVMQRACWFFEENQGLLPPANFKLGTVASHLGLSASPNHTALADVQATLELAQALAGYNRISTTSARVA